METNFNSATSEDLFKLMKLTKSEFPDFKIKGYLVECMKKSIIHDLDIINEVKKDIFSKFMGDRKCNLSFTKGGVFIVIELINKRNYSIDVSFITKDCNSWRMKKGSRLRFLTESERYLIKSSLTL